MAEERLGASFTIDVTDLKAGLRTANNLIRESQSEFKAAAAGLDNWSKSETGLNAKIKSLNQITGVQREKVRALKSEYDTLIKKGLDPASDKAIKLRTQIKNEEAALASNEKELRRNQDALKNLGKESDTTGNKLETLGKVAKTAAATIGAALAAAGAAVVGLTKNAIQNYAEYEQLVGGVSKLFGTSGQTIEQYAKSVGKSVDEVRDEYNKLSAAEKTVADNAANAFKTAGMSANEYMDTVTSFSASLIAGLGGDTQKAAEIADIAIRDMSDNANTFGTDMSSIMHTYQGFAKQNYTMLDNLKLGYGGTQAEMARLINDSGVLGDSMEVTADTVKDVPFDKLILAINETQKRMNITGTTAKEAAGTIEGSVNMMKSAWKNLVTGLADDSANLTLLIDNLVESIVKSFENILPRITTVMNGIVRLVEQLLPQIPPLIQEMLPELVKGITTLLDGIMKILPDVVKTLLEVIPMLLTSLIEMLPTMQATIVSIIVQIINALAEMLPDIVDAIMEVLPLLIQALVDAIPQLLQAAIKFLMAIVQAIPTIITALVENLPQIIDTIITTLIENMPLIVDGAVQLFMGIIKAIPQIISALITNLPQIITTIVKGLIEGIPQLIMAGGELLAGLITGLLNPETIFNACKNLVSSIVSGIKNAAVNLWNGLFEKTPPIDENPTMKSILHPEKYITTKEELEESARAKAIAEQDYAQRSRYSDASAILEAIKQNIANGTVDISNPTAVIGGEQEIKSASTPVIVNQTNNYSQQHSRYEIYQSKQNTAAAVRLAIAGVKE